jgi:hypothetical protein
MIEFKDWKMKIKSLKISLSKRLLLLFSWSRDTKSSTGGTALNSHL